MEGSQRTRAVRDEGREVDGSQHCIKVTLTESKELEMQMNGSEHLATKDITLVGALSVPGKGGFGLHLEGDYLRSWRGRAF